jgi:hypothetical protein
MEILGQKFDADGCKIDSIFCIDEMKDDMPSIHDMLNPGELVGDIGSMMGCDIISDAECFDFDGVSCEMPDVHEIGIPEMPANGCIDITLSDLICDVKDEIEMNIPELDCNIPNPKDGCDIQIPEQAHEIAPAVMPDCMDEVINIADNNNLIDISQHQLILDDA